jgi:polyphosphate kinase 2 (PPK2 family)
MDFRKKFLVGSHVKFKISNIDPAYKDTHDGQQSVVPGLARHIASLARLQYRLYAEGKRSLLIMLQGLDAAGKDGVIRHTIGPSTDVASYSASIAQFNIIGSPLRRRLERSQSF